MTRLLTTLAAITIAAVTPLHATASATSESRPASQARQPSVPAPSPVSAPNDARVNSPSVTVVPTCLERAFAHLAHTLDPQLHELSMWVRLDSGSLQAVAQCAAERGSGG